MRFRRTLAPALISVLLLVVPVVTADLQPAQGAKLPGLAALVAAPDRTLSADGVTLRYKDVGSGEPVLFIHGYTGDIETILPVAAPFAASHRIIALDVRGFGRSSKFDDPSRFGRSMIDDVIRLLDHLEVERAHLVGHSMGALIAANVAAHHSARVKSATLIAGPFYPDKATFAKESAPWVSDLESGKGLGPFIQWIFPKMDAKTATMFGSQSVKSNDLGSLIGVMRSLPVLAIRGLQGNSPPALVTVGTGDPLHPLSVDFAKASANATLLEIKDADHASVAMDVKVRDAMEALIQRTTRVAKGRARRLR